MRAVPLDAADSQPSAAASVDVSRRLREARERSGLSLRQLARRLDISASALSQIETGKSRPSVRTLYALVSELGLSLDELFDHETPARPAPAGGTVVTRGGGLGDAPDWLAAAGGGEPVQRAGSRPRLELDSGVVWERLTAHHDPIIEFLHVVYEPGGASNAKGQLVRHAGREYGIVLSGELDVTVGFETYRLGPGDSISFSSDEPHLLANNGDVPATGIWFVVGRRQSDPRNPVFEETGVLEAAAPPADAAAPSAAADAPEAAAPPG
ncbi:MAG: helix-turn-helix domain-containing protein [Solirubrobacteraceae bacterium]|nr:helix-turn-helix domain-containing protein [Solirubrobacteraceae bacterium]